VRINLHVRIVLYCSTSKSHAVTPQPGPGEPFQSVAKRARIEGFTGLDLSIGVQFSTPNDASPTMLNDRAGGPFVVPCVTPEPPL
jgi:hypothetical protein